MLNVVFFTLCMMGVIVNGMDKYNGSLTGAQDNGLNKYNGSLTGAQDNGLDEYNGRASAVKDIPSDLRVTCETAHSCHLYWTEAENRPECQYTEVSMRDYHSAPDKIIILDLTTSREDYLVTDVSKISNTEFRVTPICDGTPGKMVAYNTTRQGPPSLFGFYTAERGQYRSGYRGAKVENCMVTKDDINYRVNGCVFEDEYVTVDFGPDMPYGVYAVTLNNQFGSTIVKLCAPVPHCLFGLLDDTTNNKAAENEL